MSRVIIYPFAMGSQSSRDLRDALEESGNFDRVMRVYPDRNYRPRRDDLIINWGMGRVPEWYTINAVPNSRESVRFLNTPESVNIASNKLTTLTKLQEHGVSIPNFTTNREVADETFDGIVVRQELRGHSGNGIELIIDDETEVPEAPLYTELIENRSEYRVHVFNGEVIDYIKKRRESENQAEGDERYIKSHNNGWIFTRENLRRLECVEQLAIEAVEALGLDFGAVDIIRDRENEVYVLEVNTAVSMEGQTLENYVNAINNYVNRG